MDREKDQQAILRWITGGLPNVPEASIIVRGPVLDAPMRPNIFAGVYPDQPTYRVYADRGMQLDSEALRREIAACRLPDRVKVGYDRADALAAWERQTEVARRTHLPFGMYVKGVYALGSQELPFAMLWIMGQIPPVSFLERLKVVAQG